MLPELTLRRRRLSVLTCSLAFLLVGPLVAYLGLLGAAGLGELQGESPPSQWSLRDALSVLPPVYVWGAIPALLTGAIYCVICLVSNHRALELRSMRSLLGAVLGFGVTIIMGWRMAVYSGAPAGLVCAFLIAIKASSTHNGKHVA
jgi:hypothetical protein